MKTIEEVQRQLEGGQFEFSRHAFHRAVERNISEQEIREAGARAELIENYPTTSIRRARFCWASPRVDGRWISR